MYLTYGLNDRDELVEVADAPRGRTSLRCPYCFGPLLAKKGAIVVPHFAHAETTCRQVARREPTISIPAYDDFTLNVPGRVVRDLRNYAEGDDSSVSFRALREHDLITRNTWTDALELTKKARLILGTLSLDLFNKFQEPIIQERYQTLDLTLRYILDANERNRRVDARWRGSEIDPTTALTDLTLYRLQWQRILNLTLYFLRIDFGAYYKIGVTSRPVADRIAEIRTDLAPHGLGSKIDVLGTWPHRGNVERYFKYRYRAFNVRIGILTEYFQFPKIGDITRDLRRMQAKTLNEIETFVAGGGVGEAERRGRRS